MADQIRVMGMVISSSPIGENDKRIVLLTKEKGKISAFARGARRPGNRLMAASDSFAFGAFYLTAGRDSYSVVNAEISNYFRELAGDVLTTYTAYYFVELAGYFAVENQDGSQMLNLIYAAFKALLGGRIEPALVRCVYELKLLALNGEYPDFFACRGCGGSDGIDGFSIALNGVLCSECRGAAKDVMDICGSTLYTLQYIVCTEIKKLFSFTVSEEVLTELRMVLRRCMDAYVDRHINSLDILDGLLF
ncbi:MAG: DNA repair protein RecO [Butyrivibrio sp.]|nr:DNA repair protein RecO [Butyrivibrio sp.]